MLLDVMRVWLRDRAGKSPPSPHFVFAPSQPAAAQRAA
jgi:hypothetical protein